MIKLWGRINSINVMKVLWCLDELGVEYERVDAGLEHGVVDEPHYRALNPNRLVPTLRDGELTLWESNVIVRYLCARYGEGAFYPADVATRAVAEQWMDWQQTAVNPQVGFVFWGQIRGRKENQDPARIAAASSKLAELWGFVHRHLAGRDFLAGDTLTMGDIPLGTTLWRWRNLDVEHPDLPHLDAWYARLQARPAYQRHVMQPLT